jgi:hypothetical protein
LPLDLVGRQDERPHVRHIDNRHAPFGFHLNQLGTQRDGQRVAIGENDGG